MCDAAGVRLQDDQLEALRVARNWKYNGGGTTHTQSKTSLAAPTRVSKPEPVLQVAKAVPQVEKPVAAMQEERAGGTPDALACVPATPTSRLYGPPPRYRPTLRHS